MPPVYEEGQGEGAGNGSTKKCCLPCTKGIREGYGEEGLGGIREEANLEGPGGIRAEGPGGMGRSNLE